MQRQNKPFDESEILGIFNSKGWALYRGTGNEIEFNSVISVGPAESLEPYNESGSIYYIMPKVIRGDNSLDVLLRDSQLKMVGFWPRIDIPGRCKTILEVNAIRFEECDAVFCYLEKNVECPVRYSLFKPFMEGCFWPRDQRTIRVSI